MNIINVCKVKDDAMIIIFCLSLYFIFEAFSNLNKYIKFVPYKRKTKH